MVTNDSVSNPYIQDILTQPAALRATLAALGQLDSLQGFADQLAQGHLRRIVLTGMGASYNALLPLLLKLTGAGLPAQLIETSELIYYFSATLQPSTLLIVASQSGSSAEITHLLEVAVGHVPVIGVTNSADSPLAAKSDYIILTSAGAEFSVSCKTYVTALAALIWLGEKLTNAAIDPSRSALEQAFEAMESYLTHWEAHLTSLSEMLAGIHHLTLVGRGPSLAAVGMGALTIKEAAHFPAEGMSSAAFRHGPMEAISPDQLVLVYLGGAPTADLNKRLRDDILGAGGKAALIETADAQGALYLRPVPALAYPVIETLPAQMVSLALAQITGREAGRFVIGQKVITEE